MEAPAEILKHRMMLYDPKYHQHCYLVLADSPPMTGDREFPEKGSREFPEGAVKFGVASPIDQLIHTRRGSISLRQQFAEECGGELLRLTRGRLLSQAQGDAYAARWHEERRELLQKEHGRLLKLYPGVEPILALADGGTPEGFVGELEHATGLKCYMQRVLRNSLGEPLHDSGGNRITLDGWMPADSTPPARRPPPLDMVF